MLSDRYLFISTLNHKPSSWIFSCLRKADKNKDDNLSPSEVKSFMHLINIEVDDEYVEMLFKVVSSELLNVS